MTWQPDKMGYEPSGNIEQNPIPSRYSTGLRGTRLLKLAPRRPETGGARRLPERVDWENMVDAVYATKEKFSSN